jgi:hypothetical protein
MRICSSSASGLCRWSVSTSFPAFGSLAMRPTVSAHANV